MPRSELAAEAASFCSLHRFDLITLLGASLSEAGRLLLVPLLGKMFLKTLGNFCLEGFYPFVCLCLSGPKLLVVWSDVGAHRPGRTGIGTTKISKNLVTTGSFQFLLPHTPHIRNESRRYHLVHFHSFFLPVKLVVAYMHCKVNIRSVIIHSFKLIRSGVTSQVRSTKDQTPLKRENGTVLSVRTYRL